jgi:hypothetical protein
LYTLIDLCEYNSNRFDFESFIIQLFPHGLDIYTHSKINQTTIFDPTFRLTMRTHPYTQRLLRLGHFYNQYMSRVKQVIYDVTNPMPTELVRMICEFLPDRVPET